jgi:serine/threonine protein kinase
MKDKDRTKTRVLFVENFRGEVTPEFDDPLFLEAVSRPGDLWSRPGIEILLDQRNKVGVVRIPMSSGPPREIVIKEFAPRGLVRLKSFIQTSKALRAWRGALALKDRGLETAPPAAYLEERRGGLAGKSFFFAERVTGAEEIRSLFRRLTPSELEPLLSALAGHLSLCHDRGILHRDLSDGNILVKKSESGRFVFYLLDTNRIRLRKRLGSFRRAKNLIRLGVSAACQKEFLLGGSREKPFRRSHWFWYKGNKSVFTVYLGLKRKLRLRRIARFLRIQ